MSLKHLSEAKHNFNTTATAATINAILPIPGQRIFIYRMILTTSVACTVVLQDTITNANAGNNMSQIFQLGATGGVSLDVPFNYDPWWFTGQQYMQFQDSAHVLAAQQGGITALAAGPGFGAGLGVNLIVTSTPTLGWDIWWDSGA